jgi:hypothetical protein
LLSRILNMFFSAPKVLSIVTLSEECLRLNISLALVSLFLGPYSDRWYLTPLEGGRKPLRHPYPASAR